MAWPQTRALQRPEAPPPEPYNQLDSNETLFYVLAAINAAGYDEEAGSSTNNPLRGRVREYLAQQNLESLLPLKRFVRDHKLRNPAADLGQYISFALWSKGAPDFTPANPDLPQPADADALYEFPPVLAAFYKEARLGVLWQDAQPDYQRAIAEFHEPAVFAVQQVNAYLRNVDSGVRRGRFQILVDLLGAPNQVQFRNYIDDYFIMVTPAVEQPIFDIRHAYLRYQVDPLGARFADDLQKKARVGERALESPLLGEQYRVDFVRLATECLIKAMESRLDRKSALAEEAAREGFVLAPAFAELLPQYEHQELAMRLYLPDMIKAIDVKKEQQRIARNRFPEGTSGADLPGHLRSEAARADWRGQDFGRGRAVVPGSREVGRQRLQGQGAVPEGDAGDRSETDARQGVLWFGADRFAGPGPGDGRPVFPENIGAGTGSCHQSLGSGVYWQAGRLAGRKGSRPGELQRCARGSGHL